MSYGEEEKPCSSPHCNTIFAELRDNKEEAANTS
jgi:hypothetical protein